MMGDPDEAMTRKRNGKGDNKKGHKIKKHGGGVLDQRRLVLGI